MSPSPHVVVLAGGPAKRMRSRTPKVLHPVLFRPMLHYVLELAHGLAPRSLSVVTGPDGDEVRAACAGYPAVWLSQDGQAGSGGAALAAAPFLASREGPVLVLSGDVILLEPKSARRLVERRERESAACVLGTTTLPVPRDYGRVLRRLDGSVAAVREEADCSPAERLVNEVNAGIYCFEREALLSGLAELTPRDEEYRLPDVIARLAESGRKVLPYCFGDPREVAGIDDRVGLWQVESLLQERVNRRLMRSGVTLQDPRGTFIDPRCRVAPDVRVEAGCVLIDSTIEEGAVVEAHCRLEAAHVGAGARLRQGCCVLGARVNAGASLGPYSCLRGVNNGACHPAATGTIVDTWR